MDQKYQLPFKEGQRAEAKSFLVGYRAAWFRCKIQEIRRRRGHWEALLEYFDYPDEKWAWTELYQERQLVLRPEYPPVHLKNKVSDVSSNLDVTIVVDGTWRVGDLVDWRSDDCYWSGKVTKLLDNGKAKIELMPPPLGEGKTYDAFVKDMRPSLDWSPEFGWAVPASQDGESSRQYPQLRKFVSQGASKFKTSGEIPSNSLESDKLEAEILYLEELANKISWLKRFMECGRPPSDGVTPSWKFVKHDGTLTKN